MSALSTADKVAVAQGASFPTWLATAIGYLGTVGAGVAYYEWIKKGPRMTALEKTFRTLTVQLVQHIEELEKRLDTQALRLAESMPKSAYDTNSKRRDDLELANQNLSSENARLRTLAAEKDAAAELLRERVRELQHRIDMSKRNPNKKRR